MNSEQNGAQLSFFGFRRSAECGLGQWDIQFLRDRPHRFGKGDVLDFLDESKNVPGNAAAEAMKKLARGVDRERGSFLAMKRAEPGEILRACLFQLDVVADHPND